MTAGDAWAVAPVADAAPTRVRFHQGDRRRLGAVCGPFAGSGARFERRRPLELRDADRGEGADVASERVFLFKDGYFVQEALNDGEPFDQQLVRAHAGTYTVGATLQLVAEVQLGVSPARTPAVSSSPGRAHQISPTLRGDHLTLTFGSGSVQTFRRVGPGDGKVVLLERGTLALVDGRFLIVFENGRQIVGAGRAERRGSELGLVADRWMSARDGKARYQRHVKIDGVLEGGELRVPGEAPMRVRRAASQRGARAPR